MAPQRTPVAAVVAIARARITVDAGQVRPDPGDGRPELAARGAAGRVIPPRRGTDLGDGVDGARRGRAAPAGLGGEVAP